MNDFVKMIQEKPELQKYLFVRGFLLTDRYDLKINEYPFMGHWSTKSVGRYTAYVHEQQKVTTYSCEDKTFFLFGHAYNPFSMEYHEEKVLERIALSYGTDDYQGRIDEMTGIFVYGVVGDKGIEYIVDPSGMQSAYYGVVDGNFYLTSHAQLIGDICDLSMSETAKELTEYKWYYRVMGPYLPGDMSQFDEVKRIVPDIAYYYSNRVSHRRFYPLRDIKQCNTEKEYQQVIAEGAKILKNNMELVSKKWTKPYISLTGGIDSNTTFAAANGIYDRFKTFSYVSAEKETIDADAAEKISQRFNVDRILYNIPDTTDELENYDEIVKIIDHNNGYIARGNANEYRKRVFLIQNIDADVEVKSWVSETIRAYWYKHYGRKSMPKLSAKLFRNLYKIFIFNRKLAHEVDIIFDRYIKEFEYDKIPAQYPPADMHYNEVTWGSWGGLNISEMKIYTDITIIYNNRKFLDLMFRVPLEKRISDRHHLDMKKILNPELYDMNIRVVNMKETAFRAFMLNVIFTLNSILPF
ncbi:MAG: hypothetical protein J1F63_01145 [Oscillospiraceae bacterium]|nr:hypothetical protein [Oscillospiraceae bacterium]